MAKGAFEMSILSDFDQMETNLENVAQLISTYYMALIKKGIADEFAQQIVLDYHHCFWSTAILYTKGNSKSGSV